MIVLLTYDAPHYKTERFLHELIACGLRPDLVAGAPMKALGLPPAMRLSVRHSARHPMALCNAYGLSYSRMENEKLEGGELGIIAGARIIPGEVVNRFEKGILNLHPGAIPENRGLSNFVRAVRDGLPPCVTAHMIDGRVDAGRLLWSRRVKVMADDEPQDLSERILDTQVEMLAPAVRMAMTSDMTQPLPLGVGGYERPIHADEEAKIMREMWEDYRAKQAAKWSECQEVKR